MADLAYAPVAPLPGHKPSDGGLSGLGLIMQLVGGIMTAFVGCYGMFILIAMLQAGSRGAPGTILLWILVVVGTSLARSVAHASAGRRLLYDGPGTPASALGRYILFAAIQTGVVCAGMLLNDLPGGMILALLLMLGAWPVALLILAKPRIAEFDDAVPMADDKGFEGASILLLIFGAMGIAVGAIMLLGWLEWPAELKSQLLGVGMLVAFVMLVIRSGLHLRAGMRGISATHQTETAEAATKYAGFGVITSVVVGGIFLVSFMTSMGSRGNGAMMILMLVMVVMIAWVLLVWPLTVRRFFGERQFATLLDERAGSAQQSPDRGLPTLGWLLLAFGVFALASGLAVVLMGELGDPRAMRRMSRGGNPMGQMMGLLGSSGGKSPWLGITVAVVQVWAAVELIRMTARYKLAGMVFGGLACAVALYIHVPTLGQLMQGGVAMVSNPLAGMAYAGVAMALVVPIATLVFVQRRVRDPRALARTFE